MLADPLLHALMDSLLDGMITIDENGTVQSFNPAAERIFGYAATDVLGQNVCLLMPQPYRHEYDTAFLNHLRTGKAEIIGVEREVTGLRQDGTLFPMEIAISETFLGNQRIFIGVMRDITQRKHLEQRLRLQATALEAAANAISITDRDGNIEWINPAFTRLTGYTSEEVLGKNHRLLKSGEQDTTYYQHLWQTILVGEVWQGELINRRKDGTTYVEEAAIAPVRGASGQIANFIAIKQDITGRKEVDRMKSEFVALVSHELRTPLTSIKGYVDLLLQGDVSNVAEQQDYLRIIRSNTHRLVDLINDLLDIARIESGEIEPKRVPLDIAALIRVVADALRPQIGAKRQHLILDLAADLPAVPGDADRVVQIIANLLSNAHKYTLEGGTITVSCSKFRAPSCGDANLGPGTWNVELTVTDTGIGLTPGEQAQLFKRFYRARNEATKDVGGTGLGLAITKTLVEMHGGQITVTSAPGQGSTFSVTLPSKLQ
jgi:PAS domain S-box-containing protein